MVSESFGFTGPYICWAVLWNYVEHLETGLSMDYHNYQRLSIHFDGNSDNIDFFFKNKGGKLVEYSRYFQDLLYPSQGTQAMLTQETKKVWTLQPKPSHARGAEHEEQLEEQHRQGAAVQPYPVIT